MKCILCGVALINKLREVCTICADKIAKAVALLPNIEADILEFVIKNQSWIKPLSDKCKGKWYGKLTLSVTDSEFTHAGWYETKLLQQQFH